MWEEKPWGVMCPKPPWGRAGTRQPPAGPRRGHRKDRVRGRTPRPGANPLSAAPPRPPRTALPPRSPDNWRSFCRGGWEGRTPERQPWHPTEDTARVLLRPGRRSRPPAGGAGERQGSRFSGILPGAGRRSQQTVGQLPARLRTVAAAPPPAPDTNFIPHTWWARRPVSTVSVPEGRGVFASRERARGSHSGTHQAVTTERTKTSPLIRTQGFCSKAVAKNAKSGRGRWRGSRPDTLGQGQTEAPDRNPQGAPAAPSKTRRGNGRTVLTRAAGEGDPRPVTSCPRTGARAPGVLWAPKARHEGAAPSREESVP